MNKYLPSDAPDEFHNFSNKYNKLAQKLWHCGDRSCLNQPKEGVDRSNAIAEICNVANDWGYSHEDKMAILAYLINKYFIVEDAVPPAENKKHTKQPKQEINYCNNSRLGHGKNLQLPSLKQQLTGLL